MDQKIGFSLAHALSDIITEQLKQAYAFHMERPKEQQFNLWKHTIAPYGHFSAITNETTRLIIGIERELLGTMAMSIMGTKNTPTNNPIDKLSIIEEFAAEEILTIIARVLKREGIEVKSNPSYGFKIEDISCFSDSEPIMPLSMSATSNRAIVGKLHIITEASSPDIKKDAQDEY